MSVTPRISKTPWPMIVKFCMRNLHFLWKISTGEKNLKKETIFFSARAAQKGGKPPKKRVILKTYVVKTWKLNGSSNYVTDNYYNDFINEACSIIEQMRIIFFGIVQGFP